MKGIKETLIISLFSYGLLCHFGLQAADSSGHQAPSSLSDFTPQMALACIQLNKDLNLASQQMIGTETHKSELASKIRYLDEQIEERRRLIESLDQRHSQQNNKNYNQLVQQFNDLSDERKTTLRDYNHQHSLHLSQHNSVIRLEERLNQQCFQNIRLDQTVYQEACVGEAVRWCSAFEFN